MLGLADHEPRPHQQRRQMPPPPPPSPPTASSSGISTIPSRRTSTTADDTWVSTTTTISAADSATFICTDISTTPLCVQTPPVLRMTEPPPSPRGETTAKRRSKSRKMAVPDAKNLTSIVPESSGEGGDGGGSGSEGAGGVGDAWPWPASAPRAYPPSVETLEPDQHQKQQTKTAGDHGGEQIGQQQQEGRYCVMPPLPLAPSMRNLKTTMSPLSRGISSHRETSPMAAAGAAETIRTRTTRTDVVGGRVRSSEGVERARHSIRGIGAADDLSVVIPAHIARKCTPSQHPAVIDTHDDELLSNGSRDEQLSAEAVVWAAASVAATAEREKREEAGGDQEGKGSREEEKEEAESPFGPPPLAPPRLVANGRRRSTATVTRNRAFASANVPPHGRDAVDNSRAARAARAYAAAAAARRVREGAVATPTIAKSLAHHDDVAENRRATTLPVGDQRRPRDERSLRRSPRECGVHASSTAQWLSRCMYLIQF